MRMDRNEKYYEAEDERTIASNEFRDVRSVNESYISNVDTDLFCEYLGKMRQILWGVI